MVVKNYQISGRFTQNQAQLPMISEYRKTIGNVDIIFNICTLLNK
jgi:hypothetical protein